MTRFFTTIFFCLLSLFVVAQSIIPAVQPYGKIDTADLKMTSCDFEKDANAMVLFDVGDVNTGLNSTTLIRHRRLKILNLHGKDEANITLSYFSRHGLQSISDLQAQTINLDNGVINFIKVAKPQIFEQPVDKNMRQIAFTFPQVKPGSIIEYTYKLTIDGEGQFPDWDFQCDLPSRYSELTASVRNDYNYKMNIKTFQDLERNEKKAWTKSPGDTVGNKYAWALKNVPSYKDETYSTSREDNLESLEFFLSGIKYTYNGEVKSLMKRWWQIGEEFTSDQDDDLKESLKADTIINKAKSLSTEDEKVAYIFNWVKSNFKWNEKDRPYTVEDMKKVWQAKTGNSTEINLILYKLLVQAKINCYPLLVSTRDNGKVNLGYPKMNSFNRTDVIVSINKNTQSYILDATHKLNSFNNIPFDVLNTNGLLVKGGFSFSTSLKYTFITDDSYIVSIKNKTPSRVVIYTNAEILPDGKLKGTTQTESFSYNKIARGELFKKLEEARYVEYLKNGDNSLNVISLKRSNVDIDSLPLSEVVDFQQDLSAMGSDDTHIYCDPNLFAGFYTNPFLNEKRNTTIDFGYLTSYNIIGRFKIPDGFKVDALPQNVSLVMPDKSIVFRRTAAEESGQIMIHYTVYGNESVFTTNKYLSVHDFYKKMFQYLNEPIVLKKN